MKNISIKIIKLVFYFFFSILYLNALDFVCTHLNIDGLGIQLFLIVIILVIITSELLMRNSKRIN